MAKRIEMQERLTKLAKKETMTKASKNAEKNRQPGAPVGAAEPQVHNLDATASIEAEPKPAKEPKPEAPATPRNVSAALASILAKAAEKPEPKAKEPKEKKEKKAKEAKEPKDPNAPKGVRQGNRYYIHDETKVRPKLSPQGLFIMLKLADAGEKGLTKKELTEMAIAAGPTEFPTNQPHDRAIGFYLSAFKNEGSLAFAKEPEASKSTPVSEEPETVSEDAEVDTDGTDGVE